MKQKGYDRQSLLDLAIIAGGSVDCAITICVKNGLSFSDDIVLDKEYETERLQDRDDSVLKIIDIENIRPATALSEIDITTCPFGGIGFMGIEIDFEVS